MLNNRQGGRRRGRGGQRPQNNAGGRPEQGNRIDNRARGNAAQLLEKYKTLARDSQMQGDRVATEYFHQFADHYFRVLSETRARFEENQPRRPRDDFSNDDDFDGDDNRAEFGNEREANAGDDQRRERFNGQQGQRDQQPRSDRDRDDRPRRDREPREAEGQRADQAEQRPQFEQAPRDDTERQPRRARPRRERMTSDNDEAPAFDAALLPPSIVQADAPRDIDTGEEPAPRRRTRRPRAEDATPDAA